MAWGKFFRSYWLILACVCCLANAKVYAYQTPATSKSACPQLDTARSRLKEAQNLLSKELYNSSITILKDALSVYQYCMDGVDSNMRVLAQIDYWLGYAYFHISDYEKSLYYFYDILKLKDIEPYYLAKAYTGIANIANARRNPDEAQKALARVLEINETLDDNTIFLSVYNNLANTFSFKGAYDTALFYLEKAYEKSFHISDSIRTISIMLNMANNLQQQSKWDEAEYYYKKAIKESERQQNQSTLCETKYGLALLLLKRNQTEAGLRLLDECLQSASKLNYKRIQLLAYDRLSYYYAEQGDYPKAYTYLLKKQNINDSVFNIESERNINRLKADFDLYQIETSKQLLERDLAIYKSKIYRRNLNISILIILVLTVAGITFYIARKLMNRNKEYSSLRKSFDSLQAHIDTEKQQIHERFQSELELKHKELTTHALLLVKSEEIAGDILENIRKLKTESPKGKNSEIIREIESSARELYMGKGWEEFKYSFEQVNSSFYDNLDARYPGLTASDRRFAALLSLGLTTKEIALMTNRSVRGVETSKFRLKKKMGLDSDQNLTEILFSLK